MVTKIEIGNKKYKIGFTAGVFDMFYIGHLNVLKKAKEQRGFLIVGVSTGEVVLENKRKRPIIHFDERMKIIESIKYVDKAISQESYDIERKIKIAVEKSIDAMFVGSDWKGTNKWNKLEVF